MENPYKPPQSDVSAPDVRVDTINIFEQFSTWYVFFLSVVTFGFYNIYWLYTRAKRLNRLKGVQPLGETFMRAAMAIYVVSFPLSMFEDYFADYPGLLIFSKLLWLSSSLLMLVCVFMFRSRLNDFLEKSDKPTSTLGPIMTFFFQVIYLSYKVNENIELSETNLQS